MINILKKGNETSTHIETWIVKWNRATGGMLQKEINRKGQMFKYRVLKHKGGYE